MNEIRIPLDQYAYINVQFEGTPEETLTEYRRLMALSKAPVSLGNAPGLNQKEWNTALDHYLINNSVEMEVHEKMSHNQQRMIKELSKAILRIKNKQ